MNKPTYEELAATVEEMTIKDFASYVVMQLEGIASEMVMKEIYDCAKRKPRKYKEQSDEN